MSGVMDVLCSGCLVWLLSCFTHSVVDVWCGGYLFFTHGVVDVWCGGCLCGGCLCGGCRIIEKPSVQYLNTRLRISPSSPASAGGLAFTCVKYFHILQFIKVSGIIFHSDPANQLG